MGNLYTWLYAFFDKMEFAEGVSEYNYNLSNSPNLNSRTKIGVSAELSVSPGMELTWMIPEKIQGATISYD